MKLHVHQQWHRQASDVSFPFFQYLSEDLSKHGCFVMFIIVIFTSDKEGNTWIYTASYYCVIRTSASSIADQSATPCPEEYVPAEQSTEAVAPAVIQSFQTNRCQTLSHAPTNPTVPYICQGHLKCWCTFRGCWRRICRCLTRKIEARGATQSR